MQRTDSLERPWWWKRLKTGGNGDDRGWDGWMTSPTQWTWVWENSAAAAAAKSLQSCLTLCDPIDGPPSSPVPGILQARTLEWVAISFSNAWKWKVKVRSLSCVQLFETPWTAAYQAPPSVGFSRQEYWSRVPLPSLLTKLYEIVKDREAWHAPVHCVTKSQTQLSDWTTTVILEWIYISF